jgi:hypothetical protein
MAFPPWFYSEFIISLRLYSAEEAERISGKTPHVNSIQVKTLCLDVFVPEIFSGKY